MDKKFTLRFHKAYSSVVSLFLHFLLLKVPFFTKQKYRVKIIVKGRSSFITVYNNCMLSVRFYEKAQSKLTTQEFI